MENDYKDRMLLPATRKTGSVVFYALLICVFLCLSLWYFVFNTEAVYHSISLAPGTVTQDFRLHYSGYYRMGIHVERKFPHRELQCLLGINDWLGPKDCKDAPLRYSWTLSCGGGRMTKAGSSEKIDGGAYGNNWMETQFGSFDGRRGERCQLKLTFLEGSKLLSDASPKLHVYIVIL
jgi:hypothetical protein